MSEGYFKASREAWKWSVQFHQGDSDRLHAFKRHLRWASAAAFRRGAAEDWFAFLERPEMRPFAKGNPHLAFRPLARYMSIEWDFPQRVKILQDTYEFIHAQGGGLCQSMLQERGAILARFPLGKVGEATVRFGFLGKFRKEGELVIYLESSQTEGPISYLACSLGQGVAGWTLYVGAVQGRLGGEEEVIKEITKAMHGFRPKAFMVFLAQELAQVLRVRELRGIGNAIHVFLARNEGRSSSKKRILFDYDELWQEAGGELLSDGWFNLPLRTPRRAPEEIKPNKRGMYTKRYAMMDAISRQIRTVLTPFPRG